MLRKFRIIAALFCFLFITLLFLDFTGSIHVWFGWLAKIQFLPAVLALNVVVVLALIILTLIFGRIYCSVICPMGVFQDIVSRISSRRKKKKYRFSYSPAISWLRYGVLAVFIIALVAGISSFVSLLAPYSSYGRIVQNLFAPVYGWGNNILAYFAERADSYAFYTTDVWLKNLPHCPHDFCRHCHIGLAQRSHILQYDLSRRYDIGAPIQICLAASAYRYFEMQQLRPLRP